MKYNIAVIEDQVSIRQELSAHFARSERIECVLAVDSVEKFLKYHRDFMNIRLILMDVIPQGKPSVKDIRHIIQREPVAEVIIFSIHEDLKHILQAFLNGATGYLPKDTPLNDLETLLIIALQGKGALLSPAVAKKLIEHVAPRVETQNPVEHFLTNREYITFQMLKEGRAYEEISERLGISINGVRYYVKSVYKKFQVTSKGELFRKTS